MFLKAIHYLPGPHAVPLCIQRPFVSLAFRGFGLEIAICLLLGQFHRGLGPDGLPHNEPAAAVTIRESQNFGILERR